MVTVCTGHERQQILHTIRFRTQGQDGDAQTGHVLLVLNIPIAGKQHFPPAFGKREEFSVLL
jgi:hypothetical protein